MDKQTREPGAAGVDVSATGADIVAPITLSRRALLARGGAIATAGIAAGLSPHAAPAAAAAEYSAGVRSLEVQLDGVAAGAIRGAAGGTLSLLPSPGPSARVQVEPLRLAIGTPLSAKLHDWLLAPIAPPVELILVAQTIDRPDRRQLVLADARATEFAVGPFDAAAAEPLDVEATVVGTGIRHLFAAGGVVRGAPRKRTQPPVARNNFRLLVQGFEPALGRVRKVDRIVIRTPSDAASNAGNVLPAQVAFDVPVLDAAPFARWADDVARGRMVRPVPGVLQVFDATGSTRVATIDLIDLTIVRFTASFGDVSGSQLEYATIALQPREIRFSLKGLTV